MIDYPSLFHSFPSLTDNWNLSIGKLYHIFPKKSLIFTIFAPKYPIFPLPFPNSYTNIPFASLSYPQNIFHIPHIFTNQIRYNPCLLPISALFHQFIHRTGCLPIFNPLQLPFRGIIQALCQTPLCHTSSTPCIFYPCTYYIFIIIQHFPLISDVLLFAQATSIL